MNKLFKLVFSIVLGSSCSILLFAQSATFTGKILNQQGNTVFGASVILVNENTGIVTKSDGTFSISVPAGKKVPIEISFLGYSAVLDTLYASVGETVKKDYVLYEKLKELEEIIVKGVQERENTLARINMKSIHQLPNTSGNIETLLKTFSNVVSGNELSSQYSVRGGNYDENLIYVNDIEINRPMLVQSAQQEGLSFVNPDMVSSIQFSAGGFESKYGDKMSSVLDISYKKPVKFESSATVSLLGSNLHVAGISKNKKFTHNTGLRYKTSQYILSSLEVKGEYMPRFFDLQTYMTYDISSKSSISVLGNLSLNRFTMLPETRETNFGTISQTLSFNVFYEGSEKDRFDSYMGAISYNFSPNRNTMLKLIASSFNSDEEITYDILSEYYISQAVGKGTKRDTVINIGTGASLEHARKYLNSRIHSIEHKGTSIYGNNSVFRWGLKAQYEEFDDFLREWGVIDSTGFFIPDSDGTIEMEHFIYANNFVSSARYQAFVQNQNSLFSSFAEYSFTYGLRANYLNYNKELIVSPRVSFTLNPYWKKDIDFFFAAGLYSQPPQYKELKDYTGKLYNNVMSQKSFHLVIGADMHYLAWNRPFTFTTEIYYKNLYQLIPYKVENIQVHYLPAHDAKGYAAGIDFRVNGEFVSGAESWFSLSLMQTKEDTYNDFYTLPNGTVVYPAYYRRPTDQTITFSVFFQDYLPSHPDYKMHLLINYGSGLPYSGPTANRPSEIFLLGPYRRVDIGASRIIKRDKNKKIGLKDIWITFECLNLMGIKNMASYDWVKTVDATNGQRNQFAVPNYLTGRRFNLKISTKL
ncbi:MAG: carboxypeptidase-like regulatory domain-containing protein [Bacteroidales bacterium]|nr:carboxypeptidase-like regulatory domain-containing protein [Bacteroidales bacterium]